MARRLIGQFGAPRAILTDRGAAFTSGLLREIAKIVKIEQLTTSGYRPQTNGALERSHIMLAEYIKHYINQYDDWDRLLPYAELSYNTGVHEATNFTPYEIVFGRLPRLPSQFPTEPKLSTYNDFTSELIKRLSEIREIAGENINKSKETTKKYYDLKTRPFIGKAGDEVWVKKEVRKGKFDSQYHGPYTIKQITDRNNVILETSNGRMVSQAYRRHKVIVPITAKLGFFFLFLSVLYKTEM